MSSKNDKKSQKNKEEKEFVDVRSQWDIRIFRKVNSKY